MMPLFAYRAWTETARSKIHQVPIFQLKLFLRPKGKMKLQIVLMPQSATYSPCAFVCLSTPIVVPTMQWRD